MNKFCSVLALCVVATCGSCSDSGDRTPAFKGTAFLPEGAVLPTDETVSSGEYTPLSRPLFIYVNKASLKKPAVAAYVTYYLSGEAQPLVSEVGYVRLHADQLANSRARLSAALEEAGVEPPQGIVSGEVSINGSSTVAPISSAITEELAAVHRELRAPVGTAGTGGGFKEFVRGTIDICDASRPIKPSEQEQCTAAGIEYIELPVAIDGLTVVVNKDNNWVDGLTVAQLKQIWEPGSTIQKWSDIDPGWPAREISLFGPDTDSGTFDYFTEVVCGEAQQSRTDYQPSANDNVLANGVIGETYSLGYFGYAYYLENKDDLKALAIAP